MNAVAVIVAIGLGTYLLRASMFLVVGRRSLPAWVDQPLALVGPAAIAALIGSMLFTDHGHIQAAPIPRSSRSSRASSQFDGPATSRRPSRSGCP